ncbi:hypothetical protein H4Q26_008624 [Puccinia striiformis f. sp. tritici PST-130]|nr:hypothetical protein H4Q26_008624 [Puccinia striiformis f. sp. tritici PST-130]
MRVLWNKISEGSPTNPPFALDRELNSKTLSLLDNSPAYIVDRFGVVAQKLFGIHHDLDDDNGVVDDGWQIPFRFQINVISMEVESTLDPLDHISSLRLPRSITLRSKVTSRLGFRCGKVNGVLLRTNSSISCPARKAQTYNIE